MVLVYVIANAWPQVLVVLATVPFQTISVPARMQACGTNITFKLAMTLEVATHKGAASTPAIFRKDWTLEFFQDK